MIVQLTLFVALTAPQIWSLDASKSSASYNCVHKLHEFTGVDKKLEGKAKILDDGTVQAMVRGSVKDFDSGNGNRDEHMQETVEAQKFPELTVKALTKVPPAKPGTAADATAKLEMTLHGVAQTVSVPLKVEYASESSAHITGVFDTSVEGFQIKRPSLLFVPINDAMKIKVDLWFTKN